MILNEVLTLVAAQIKADPQALIAFAAEDTLGGYDINEDRRKFPMGSLWEPEGKILYALIRWLKPEVIAEIGGWAGCSAAHLAAAVRANGKGRIYSVDNGSEGMKHGHLLPDEFREFVTLVSANGEDWLSQQPDHSIGLLFEDASHGTALVALLARLAVSKVEPGGVMVNHDAAHDFAFVGGGQRVSSPVGREVRDGLAQANVYFRPYLAEPSDCGVAITLMPGVRGAGVQATKPMPAETVKPISIDDLKAALQGLSGEEVAKLLENVKPQPAQQAKEVDCSPFDVHTRELNQTDGYVGNANIESQSEPPSPKQMPSPNEKGFKTEPTITYNPQLVEEIKKQVEQPKSKRPTKAK